MKTNTRTLTTMAMLAALSVVLVLLVHFPIFPQAAFLEYDPAQIPILIGAFALGPWQGLLITVVAAVVQGVTVSAQSGPYGIIMHILGTGTYVLVAGFIYRYKKTRLGAGIAIGAGAIAMALVMAGANLLITPLFMGVPVSAVWGMLLPVIIPFNLIKAVVNGLVTFIIYKPMSFLIHGKGSKRTA